MARGKELDHIRVNMNNLHGMRIDFNLPIHTPCICIEVFIVAV